MSVTANCANQIKFCPSLPGVCLTMFLISMLALLHCTSVRAALFTKIIIILVNCAARAMWVQKLASPGLAVSRLHWQVIKKSLHKLIITANSNWPTPSGNLVWQFVISLKDCSWPVWRLFMTSLKTEHDQFEDCSWPVWRLFIISLKKLPNNDSWLEEQMKSLPILIKNSLSVKL